MILQYYLMTFQNHVCYLYLQDPIRGEGWSELGPVGGWRANMNIRLAAKNDWSASQHKLLSGGVGRRAGEMGNSK